MFADLAGGGAPLKLATQTYYDVDPRPDGQTLVYLQPGEGLHVVTLP